VCFPAATDLAEFLVAVATDPKVVFARASPFFFKNSALRANTNNNNPDQVEVNGDRFFLSVCLLYIRAFSPRGAQ